jgi:acyl-CoA synthetase (AMP-forming)/AMP-acid ligase II/thioesterase domain-containing protein/acyl carrier protein
MEIWGETLVDLLRGRAIQQPDRLAYSFLPKGESEEARFTYAELDLRARAISVWLSSVLAAGDRVLLLSSSGPEFVSAVFGCLYRGAIAVPAYPLDPARIGRIVSRLHRILKDAEPVVALTTGNSLRSVEDLVRIHPEWGSIRWVATESIPLELAGDWKRPPVHADTLAILQYTSGSLAAPKGVMASHRNVLENEKMLQESHGYTENNTFVGWIPLAHDWGLINNVFQPVYSGAPSVLMPPEAFLQKPVRWLQTISRYKNVTSGGPGFGYELCLSKIPSEERKGLNLENWICAGIGASPVRPATLDRFTAGFKDCGFRRQAFYCGYGLAEATLSVSASEKSKEPRILRVQRTSLERNDVEVDPPEDVPANYLVSCGKAPSGGKIVIADVQSRTACPSGRVGEIWVSGPNITQGYWNNPRETEDTFRAFLKDSGGGPFLRTGDLGFLHQGELYVTGRLKDLIIVRGRNLYPEDIEQTVEQCHKGLRPGCTVAFSVQHEFDEGLAIVQEVRASHQTELTDIIDAIRQAVLRVHEIVAHNIVLVQERSVPKTSSGKLQRSACRAAFFSGSLEVLQESTLARDRNEYRRGSVAPRTPVEEKLARIWCEVLNVEQIGIHDQFFDIGGDSLAATQCLARIAEEFAVEQFTREIFLYAPTLAEMAKAISDPAEWAELGNEVLPLQSNGGGVPLVLIFPGTEYLSLVRSLGPDRNVLGIRDIGIEGLPVPHSIEQIASECVARLRRHVSRGPYALAGWCASAIVALEMARRLEEDGEQVAFVALFDARDIFLPPMNQFRRTVVRSWRFAQRIVFFGSEARSLWQKAADWNAGVRKAAHRFQKLAADPSGVVALALRDYQPKPWSGRMLHLWAAERPKGAFRDPEFIWGNLSPAGYVFHEVPGDHDSMLREPNASTIAEILGAELSKAEAETAKAQTNHGGRHYGAQDNPVSHPSKYRGAKVVEDGNGNSSC